MESIQDDLEASQDFTRIYRNFENNNSSDVNLSFGTDATGIIGVKERMYHKEELSFDSLKTLEESNLFRESSLIKPELIYYPKILRDTVAIDSLHTDIISLRLSLQFSEKVEDLIIHDSIFRKFISQIERSLNQFIEYENVDLENRIFFEEDWEIPDYEKLVLSLNFKGIPFEQEMLLWKLINKITYESINSLILISSEEEVRSIKELKKKIFIKLEM